MALLELYLSWLHGFFHSCCSWQYPVFPFCLTDLSYLKSCLCFLVNVCLSINISVWGLHFLSDSLAGHFHFNCLQSRLIEENECLRVNRLVSGYWRDGTVFPKISVFADVTITDEWVGLQESICHAHCLAASSSRLNCLKTHPRWKQSVTTQE